MTPEQFRDLSERLMAYSTVEGGKGNTVHANDLAMAHKTVRAHAAALEELAAHRVARAELLTQLAKHQEEIQTQTARAERAEVALAEAKEKNGELHMVNHELHRQLAESERKGREAGLREAAEICTAIAKRSVGNTQADGSRNVYLYEQGIGAERCESVIRAAIGE